MPPLSAEHKKIINDSWATPWNGGDCSESGQAILIRFFGKYPENQNKFMAFKNKPISELKGSAAFRSHATRILTTFNKTIVAMDSPNCVADLEEIWGEIAASHVKRKIEKQAYMELRECILEVMTEAFSLNEQQQVAWTCFIDYIYEILFAKMP